MHYLWISLQTALVKSLNCQYKVLGQKRQIATIIKSQGDLGLIHMQLEQFYIMH